MKPPLTDRFSRPLIGPDNKPIKDIVRTGTRSVMYLINVKETEIGENFPSPVDSDCWTDSDSEDEEMTAGIGV